jgi:predicted ATPase
MISGVTARLVHGAFVLADLGIHRLKGVTEPLTVARVLGLRDATSDDKQPVSEAGSVLLGRDEEIGLLRRRWEQSKQGVGQVVLVSGEAGIGKSSLVDALRTHVRQEGHTRITWRCSPYHTHSALYPVIKHIQQLLSYDSDTSPAVKLSKLEEMLRAHSLPLADMVPLIAALLAVPLPAGRYPAPALTPQQQRKQTQDALIAWLLAEAECRPILAVWEDLHWADPSTLELLSQLVDQVPTASMLTVLTFRPEFVPSWPTRSHMTPLTLNSLERPQVEALIRHLAGEKALPAEVVRHIVAKTDGVPLFVEELTKMLLESALLHAAEDRYALTGSLAAVTIPTTLQDSLMARLDRLPTAREVAQLAAVLGREFSYEMLQVLAVVEEPALQHGLAQLVGAELLYQRGRPPRARYVFKHALIQDAAYASLLRSTRQRYHQRIAHVLETHFRDTAETQPELLAHHYMEAGFGDQAVIYWQRAGQYAIERSAYAEAIGHLSKGLTVLPTLPATAERLQHELHMQLTLGTALMATRGYGAPEVGQTYARARELCQHGGDTQQHFRALWGLWRFYVVGQEVAQARPLAQQLFALAQQAHDVAFLIAANNALGITLFYLGDFTSALSHLEAAMALYNPAQHRALAFIYGQDPGVICYAFAALTLWLLGYPDQALQRSQEALACAQDPFSRAYALFWTALPPQFCGRRHTVYDQADTTIALSAEQGFTLWQAGGMILQGWARTHQGQAEEGNAQVSQGLMDWRATGGKRPQPYLLALLAETYNNTGQTTEGLIVLAEALAEVEHYGERWWEAELHRLTGELLLAQMPRQESEAEACFQRAIDVATGQQARSLALRATVSLGRLWQHQGKHEPGQQLLAPRYAWFTEGFETADLTEARALLTALLSQQEP